MKNIFRSEVFRIFFGAAVFLFAFSGKALAEKFIGFPTYTKIDQLFIERWTVDEGLISNNLTSVYQSSDGYLWFTSFNGLNRFDGAEFDLYHKENTPALLTNAFYQLYENDSGNLFAATQGSYILKMANGEFRPIGNQGNLSKSVRVIV